MVFRLPATPGMEHSEQIVEQIIRPTGLVDPEIEVRPRRLRSTIFNEVAVRVEHGEWALITTLTIKMAEDLTDYLRGAQRQGALHARQHRDSDRSRSSGPRTGEFCLSASPAREGLTAGGNAQSPSSMPTREALARERALIQTRMRRPQREGPGNADRMTDSMKAAIGEGAGRSRKPTTSATASSRRTISAHLDILTSPRRRAHTGPTRKGRRPGGTARPGRARTLSPTSKLRCCAEDLKFEYAAKLRDEDRKGQLAETVS